MSLPAQNRSSTTWAFHSHPRKAPVIPPTLQTRHIHPQQPPRRQRTNHLSWQMSCSLRTLPSKNTSSASVQPLAADYAFLSQQQPNHTTMQHLFHLHRALLSILIHYTQYSERAEAIFTTGLIHLTLLFSYPSTTHRSQQWRNRFRQLHILPHTYHYHNFLSHNSVYIKLYFNPTPPHRCYHQHGHFYIGSTAIGIPHREHNRKAKLKQLQNNVPISAELSLRYWHSHNNIHHYTTIQLTSHDTYDQAWIQEHHHIANWMPTLNWPFISHHLKLKAQGWQFTKHRAHFYSRLATHKRLFRRLRLRQQTLREPHLYTSTKHHALTLLRDLTKHTAASFEAAKQLRSEKDWLAAIELLVPQIHLPDAELLELLRSCVPEQGIRSMEEAQALLLRNFRVGGNRPSACAQWLTEVTRALFDLEVYAIRRMAANLEEPGRSRALHHQQSPPFPQSYTTQAKHSSHCTFPGAPRLHKALPTVAPYHHPAAQTFGHSSPPPVSPPT